MSGADRRGEGIRRALAGEHPVKPLVTVCGWCPDREDQAAAARACGFEVSHGLCAACTETLGVSLDLAAVLEDPTMPAPPLSRRDWLFLAGMVCGLLALGGLYLVGRALWGRR